MRRREAWIAALLGFAIALACASTIPGLGDPDAFGHLSYARRLVGSGFRLRGHPFLPFTVLAGSGVDPWWGFHLLLVPFVPLGDLWGARLAGACIAALVAGSLAWLLRRLGCQRAWPFALAPLALSATFLLRGHVARPAHLTIPILLFELAAGAGELPVGWAGGLAFVHGLLHLSSPLAPIFAGLGAVASRAAGGRGSGRAVLWAVGGLALALCVRPDRGLYPSVAFLHNLVALGWLEAGHLPHAGGELLAPSGWKLLREAGPGLVLIGAALALGRGGTPSGSRPMRAAALLATLACALLVVRSQRFLDYLVPLQSMTAALFWPRAPAAVPRVALRAASIALGAAALLSMGASFRAIAGTLPKLFDGPETYARLAGSVRAQVPAGEVLFTDDPFVTEILLSVLPEYRYVLAYDPAFLWLASQEGFQRWHHAVAEGTDCPQPRCAPAPPSGAAVARVIGSFETRWAITSYPRGRLSAQEVMGRDPARFALLGYFPGTSFGLYLWRVLP